MFARVALADGTEQSRVALGDRSIAGEIAELPDGASYFAAVDGIYPGNKGEIGETFRARIDAKTGKLLATWHGPDYEWGNAVSPNARWAASVGVQRVMRLRLDDPKAPVESTAGEDKPNALALSPDATSLAAVTSSSLSPMVSVFDIPSGTKRGVAPAPEFAEAIEFSADTPTRQDLAIADGDLLISGDGRTRLTWENDDSMDHTYLRCTDVATNKTLSLHLLPDDVTEPYAISRDGAFVAATDRASVLIYPCRGR